MKAKNYRVSVFLGLLVLAVGGTALVYPFKLSEPNVTVDVIDKRYACGECYVRFGVVDVRAALSQSSSQNIQQDSPERFKGRDVLVIVRGDDSYLSRYQEERFAQDPNCAWPTFRLTGQFKRRFVYALLHEGDRYNGTYFDASAGVAINKDATCTKFPDEVPLA